MVEPEVVGKEVGDPALERVELRESVLAQAEEEVRPQTGLADRRCELIGEFVALVVEEVLLELIEDRVDISAYGLRGGGQPLGQTAARLDSDGGVDRLSEPAPGIAGPRRVEDDPGVRDPAKSGGDRGAEERCLSHSARPVQHGQAGREQVRHDHFPLAVAAAEKLGVELGVLERREPLERRWRRARGDVHSLAPAGWAAT